MLQVVDRTARRSRTFLQDVNPVPDQVLDAAVRYYSRLWIEAGRLNATVRFDAPIEPMRIFEVDPAAIDQTVSWTEISPDRKADEHPRFRSPKYRLAGRVFGGDWDDDADPVIDSTIHRSFVEHFEHDIPWEETAFYAETLTAIENGAAPWGCTSHYDLEKRCDYLDRLYDRIANEGYKTQDELYEMGVPTSDHRLYRVIWEEIAVNVGRNGEFILQDGRNRLAIAQLLGLESIPVVILVRHRQWQRLRDRIARGEVTARDLPVTLRDHPDLQAPLQLNERKALDESPWLAMEHS